MQVKFGQPTNTTAGYLDGYFSFSISLDPATPIDLKGPKGTLYDIPSHAFVFLRPPGATMNHSYVHGVFQAKGLGNLLGSDATTCIELSWIGTADGVPEPGLNEWLTQARISRDLFNLFK